jgi:hypothetical protein
MARPLVLIFQELASPQTTPATPDLNTIIVGPAYDLFDYPDDASTILLPSTYGELEMGAGNGTYATYAPPATGTDAVTVLDSAYPGQSAGSRVDHASVKAWLRMPRVVMGSTSLSSTIAPVFGASVTTSASDRTLITITGTPTTNFVAAGIQPGDRIILTSSNTSVEQTVVRVVQSVGEPNAAGLVASANVDKLRLTQQLPDAGSGEGYWVYDTTTEIRIERTLASQQLIDTTATLLTFPEPGTDKLVIKGGVTLPVVVTPAAVEGSTPPSSTTEDRALSYAEIYLPYRALRQDLQAVGSATADSIVVINGVTQITGLGKIDARNPLAVGVYVALQNAGSVPIYYYGVATDDAAGHLSARGQMGSRRDLYCFVPLTTDIQIHAAYKTEFDQIAEPSYAQQYGVVQKFRIAIGSVPLPVSRTIASGSISGVSSQPTGVNTNKNRTLSIASTSTGVYPANSVNVRNVLPGDSVTIGMISTTDSSWQTRRGTHLVGHVNSSANYPNSGDPSALEIIPGTSRWLDGTASASAADIEVLVRGTDGNVKMSSLAQVDITDAGGSLRFLMKNPTVVGGPYTITYALNAALTSVGINIAGFAVTITVNGSHTHKNVKDAVAAHPVLSTLMSVEILSGTLVAVDAASQATRDAVSGQTGSSPATIAGATAGNTRIQGLSGMVTQSVGRYLTLTGFATTGYNGTFLIAAFIDANTVDIVNATALSAETGGTWTERYAYTSVAVVANSCTATVALNDNLFNKLTDSTALFLTAGVLPGDVLEFPLDPNNYAPTAFDERVLSYRVSTVQNENNLLIANGEDDTASIAKELPHYFVRDYQDRWLDDATPNALNYRIRRSLSLDEQVFALVQTAQSVRSKRLTMVWPDLVEVSDLRDGSLGRSIPSTRTLAGLQPSTYLACAVAGVVAGVPPQAGLTNGSFIGFSRLVHAQGYFSETQLSRISDGGHFVCIQRTPGALPECIHQLTTNPTAIETGELSVVKNVDFLSKFFQDLLETFIGQYNVLPETLNEIYRAVSDGAQNLQSRRIARFGAPLISGTITSLAVSEFSADRIELFFRGTVARPLNTVAFHLVV